MEQVCPKSWATTTVIEPGHVPRERHRHGVKGGINSKTKTDSRGETNLGNIAITEGTNGAVKRMQLVPRVKRGCLQASPVLDDCRDHVTDLACVLVQVDETGATVLPK